VAILSGRSGEFEATSGVVYLLQGIGIDGVDVLDFVPTPH
jgi:hypothetical protein